MEYMILFFTHSGSIKFHRKCKKNKILCELMPVPRALSSNCSVSAKISTKLNIMDLIDDEVEKVFLLDSEVNKLVYESQ